MGVIVKICGLTNLPDARVAVEAGADALGFIFYEPSPRYVPPATAAGIIRALPPAPMKVGVFVNAPAAEVFCIIQQCGLSLVQFHGDETPEYCRQFPIMTMKAFRMKDEGSLKTLPLFPTDAWLLDTYAPGLPGGTGAAFNWDLALAARELGRPVFLAGGLTPENVGEAVRRVQPFGVDVSSGVEATPGRKDPQKVQAFIAAAKAAPTAD